METPADPSSPTPVPALAERPRFRLPLVAWVVWAVYAGWWVTRVLQRSGGATAAEWGVVAGLAGGTLIFATIAAWIAWRVAQRPNSARTIAFLAVLAAVAGTQAVLNLTRGPTRAAWVRIAEDHQRGLVEQRQSIAAGQPLDPKAETKNAERLAANLRTAAENSTGETKAAAEAGQALAEQLLAANRRYNAAVAKLNLGTFFDLAPLANRETLAARREMVQEFAVANAGLRDTQVGGAAILKRELEKRSASPAFAQSAVASYEQNAAARVILLDKVRLTDAQLATTMQEFLDLAEGRFGTWRVADASGQVIFENPAAGTRANELKARLQAIGTAQAAYQKQLVGAR